MRITIWRFFFVVALLCLPRLASAQLSATPDPMDFGDVILTELRDDQLVIENVGPTNILINNFAFTTPGNGRPSEFEILSPTFRTFQMAPGDKRTIVIRFTPDFEGVRSITLLFETDQGNFPFEIKGTGILTHPELTLSTGNLNFGKVSLSGKKQATVDIKNVGEDDAKISDVNIANFSGVEHFKAFPDDLAKPFPVILAQGESMRLRVTFEGAAPLGFKAGNITLVGSVGGQTVIDLSGEVVGADLKIDPDPIDFGDVEIGTPVTKIVTLTAISEEPIEIDYINDLIAPFAFITPPTVPLTLQPGVPYQLEIRLNADAPGPLTSQIQFVSEDFSGSNFKGVNITANGLTPIRVAGSQDFTFYCGSKKVITRTASIENKGLNPITIQSYVAPAGVTVVTGTPLQVAPTSSTAITYDFDPTVSGIERDLVIEYLDASSVLVRDTVHVTPVTADIHIKQDIESNGIDVQGVAVASTFDLTEFEVHDLDLNITFDDQDIFALANDSITLNRALLPNATYTLTDKGAGSYTLQIRSVDPIVFDPSIPAEDQEFFVYHPRTFAARDISTLAHVELINSELCANLRFDTVTLSASGFCGDDYVRSVLSDEPISSIRLYPNPVVRSDLRIGLLSRVADDLSIRILDLAGHEVHRLETAITPGSNSLMLPIDDLNEGTYLILLRSRSLPLSRELKFVIER